MAAEIDQPARLVRRKFSRLLLIRQDLASPELVAALDRLLSGSEPDSACSPPR